MVIDTMYVRKYLLYKVSKIREYIVIIDAGADITGAPWYWQGANRKFVLYIGCKLQIIGTSDKK